MSLRMPEIKKEYKNIQKEDIYSMLLFVLFKLRDSDEFSSLSELAYVLDYQSFLKFCEFFGGETITVPTIDELEDLIHALVLYQYIDIEHIERYKAFSLVDKAGAKNNIAKKYDKVREVLTNYDFTARKELEQQ